MATQWNTGCNKLVQNFIHASEVRSKGFDLSTALLDVLGSDRPVFYATSPFYDRVPGGDAAWPKILIFFSFFREFSNICSNLVKLYSKIHKWRLHPPPC
jgi:hypothetical protein